MVKYNLTNSLIGSYYPFFLSNPGYGNKQFLVYEIISPGLSPQYIPYITLKKLNEKTFSGMKGKEIDLLTYCTKMDPIEFTTKILKKDSAVVTSGKNPTQDMPLVEMNSGNNIQKSLIVGIREQLRKDYYKLFPGKQVDILWGPGKYAIFNIAGDNDTLWLEPVGIFNTLTDMFMENPLNQKLEKPKEVFTGKGKVIDLLRYIKRLEWESFGKK